MTHARTQAHGFAPALDALVVQSAAALPANREVFLFYGQLSPGKLLQLYGFLPPPDEAATASSDNSSHRYAAINVYTTTDPAGPGQGEQEQAKAQALAALGLPLSGVHSVTLAPDSSGSGSGSALLPPGLLATLRIQRAATPEEMGRLALARHGPLSPANERAALSALRGALQGMRAALPRHAPLPPPAQGEVEMLLRMVDRYLESERRVLEGALRAVGELEQGIAAI